MPTQFKGYRRPLPRRFASFGNDRAHGWVQIAGVGVPPSPPPPLLLLLLLLPVFRLTVPVLENLSNFCKFLIKVQGALVCKLWDHEKVHLAFYDHITDTFVTNAT